MGTVLPREAIWTGSLYSGDPPAMMAIAVDRTLMISMNGLNLMTSRTGSQKPSTGRVQKAVMANASHTISWNAKFGPFFESWPSLRILSESKRAFAPPVKSIDKRPKTSPFTLRRYSNPSTAAPASRLINVYTAAQRDGLDRESTRRKTASAVTPTT